jgi:hypothetical protein
VKRDTQTLSHIFGRKLSYLYARVGNKSTPQVSFDCHDIRKRAGFSCLSSPGHPNRQFFNPYGQVSFKKKKSIVVPEKKYIIELHCIISHQIDWANWSVFWWTMSREGKAVNQLPISWQLRVSRKRSTRKQNGAERTVCVILSPTQGGFCTGYLEFGLRYINLHD